MNNEELQKAWEKVAKTTYHFKFGFGAKEKDAPIMSMDVQLSGLREFMNYDDNPKNVALLTYEFDMTGAGNMFFFSTAGRVSDEIWWTIGKKEGIYIPPKYKHIDLMSVALRDFARIATKWLGCEMRSEEDKIAHVENIFSENESGGLCAYRDILVPLYMGDKNAGKYLPALKILSGEEKGEMERYYNEDIPTCQFRGPIRLG